MDFDHDAAYIALQGHSDATRDIGVAVQKKAQQLQPRSHSWSGTPTGEVTLSQFATPGGFRRQFVLSGVGSSSITSPPAPASEDFPADVTEERRRASIEYASTTDFVDQLLQMYFLGVEEEGEDEEDREVEEQQPGIPNLLSPHIAATGALPRPRSGNNKKRLQNRATVSQPKYLVIMMVKATTGTIALFLPRMMSNAGVLLGSITFVAITGLSYCGVHLLVKATIPLIAADGKVPTYGEVSTAAMGKAGGRLAEFSFGLTQLGFGACYIIFITKNTQQLAFSLSECGLRPASTMIAGVATGVLIPLCWVRKMRYFAYTNLAGNVCIVASLILVLVVLCFRLAIHGPPASPPRLVNLDSYALALGTAVCAFEGAIGCALPMYESAAPSLRPHFLKIFMQTIACVVSFLTFFGAVSYLALTDETQTIVLLNLPSWPATGSTAIVGVQVAYILAVICTYPLVFFPVVTVIEAKLMPRSGRLNWFVKAKKNTFRMVLCVLITIVALACEDNLDNYVALIGGLCSTPVALVYPPIIHASLIGGNRLLDGAMLFIGICLMVFTTWRAISTWGSVSSPAPPC